MIIVQSWKDSVQKLLIETCNNYEGDGKIGKNEIEVLGKFKKTASKYYDEARPQTLRQSF